EHGRIGLRDLADDLADPLHEGMVADDGESIVARGRLEPRCRDLHGSSPRFAHPPAGLHGSHARPVLCAPAWRVRFMSNIGRTGRRLEGRASRRGDGRRPTDLRSVRLVPGFLPDAEGSVLVEMGGTRVICTATVQEGVPPFLRGRGTGWVTAEY